MHTFLKSAILDKLELLQSTTSHHSYPTHFHETFCISLIKKGVFNENEVTATAGSILISSPNEIHSNITAKGNLYTVSTIYVNEDIVASLTNTDTLFSQKIISDNEIAKLFAKTEDSFLSTTLENNLKELLNCLVKKYGYGEDVKKKQKNDIVPEVESYILQNLMTKITLQDLAKIADLDIYKFIRLFKKQKGLTPFEFITIKRVEFAKQLLLINIPIAHVALEAGFYDQSIFSNYFKKYTGLTPAQFKKACNILQD